MFWKLFSLIAVTVGFLALVVWVYLPRNKSRLEEHGHIPLEDDSAAHDNASAERNTK